MSWEVVWNRTVSPHTPEPEAKRKREKPERRRIGQSSPRNLLGSVLAEFRTERTLTQAKLAELADVDHSFVSRIESGSRAVSLSMAVRLSQALNLAPDDHNRLLIAAGFVPDELPLIVDERLHRISAYLESRDVSIETKTAIGELLNVAMLMGEREAA